MSTLTFLHLSDLQLRSPRAQEQVAVLDGMCDDVRQNMSGRGIDFIVVAGDIAFSGEASEYEEAAQFFDKFLSIAKLPRDRLFVVPGNHDVSRRGGIPTYLRRLADSREAVIEILADSSILRELLARFEGYREFLYEYLHLPFDENSFYAVKTFDVSGLHIAVLELNTVLFSAVGEYDRGNLILGERQVREALDFASEADVRIAVYHHPLNWLKEFDRNLVEPLLFKECDFLLHGHQHHERVLRLLAPSHGPMILSSGRRPAEKGESLTYNIIHLDFVKGQGTIEIRQYSPDLGYWGPDKLVFPSIPGGIYAFAPTKWSTLGPAPTTGVGAPLLHNLPQPDYGSFVGREKELARVQRILRPYPHSLSPILVIDGIGGIGKSALALEVAHRYLRDYDLLPPEERFEAIIWTSARPTVLTADGIVSRPQITRTLNDICGTISITLGHEDITRARPEEQDALVLRALTQQRTLLIVDNLETVDDERVNAFLRELPTPTKAIVTTRHRIDVAYPIRLTGMSREDGLALIAQECAKKGVTPTEAEAEKLYVRTGGVPLAIVWSVAQMGSGYDVEAVLQHLGQPTEDILRFCFERSIELASKPAQQSLMALSLFATNASREAVGYVAGLGNDVVTRDEALVQLEKLSLMNRHNGRFTMLPLTKTYVEGTLAQESDFEPEARERWARWYLNFTQDIDREDYADPSGHYELDVERENLLYVLSWCLMHDNASGLEILLRIANYLYVSGFWMHLEGLCEGWLPWAREGRQVEAVTELLGWLAQLAERQSHYQEATEYLREGLRLAEATGDAYQVCRMSNILGQVHFREGRFDEAIASVERSIGLAKDQGNMRQSVIGHYTRAQVALAQGQIKEAKTIALTALRQAMESKWQRTVAYNLSLLADIARAEGNLAEARRLYLDGLTIAEEWRDKLLMAKLRFSMALLEEELGNYINAASLAEEAQDLFRHLGAESETAEVEAMLVRVRSKFQ